MQCFNVKCSDENGIIYNVGVMTSDKILAADSAIRSMKEGRHIDVIVQIVEETDGI